MASTHRRIGAENSETRASIIKAAELVIREEGYAAASTRRVAARAGLKPSLVHYYFPTTDDLLLALHAKGAAESDAALEKALASPNPLRSLWQMLTDDSRMALAIETMAMANHRKGLQAAIAEHAAEARNREVEVLTRLIGERLAGVEGCTPAALSVVLAGIGRALVMEAGLGISTGHAEARACVERWLDELSPDQNEAAGKQA